jgi:uncharacterized protein (DUF1778 family)
MTRTSQLQIRISPQEKAALKRLAGLAGQSVSAYVLSRALPSSPDVISAALHGLRAGSANPSQALAALKRMVVGLSPEALAGSLAEANVSDLPPATQNYVAGVTEQLAAAAGIEPPAWAASVPPLERPHFKWPLQSLRPYQLRASPLSLKRRNVFDPTLREAPVPREPAVSAPEGRSRLELLSQHIASLELDVEFYFIADAILSQAFPSETGSARPAVLFRLPARGSEAVAGFVQAQGWPEGWIQEALRPVTEAGRGPGPYLELPRVQVFAPPPAYALAMKLAARSESDARATGDLRFLLRTLNLLSAEAALSAVGQYVTERQLPGDTRAVLTSLIGR